MSGVEARDEMVDGHGGLRPHWRGILSAFAALGEGGLAERALRLDRAFAEEGVSSLLPGASSEEHAWRCDPVPLPIQAGEFAELEAGLAQRATLLEAILDDLYDGQQLLADGALPPALVFANPGWLRVGDLGGNKLQFYAADLIRAPDGVWHVLADRTAAGGGIGYARENRRLLARVLPETFRPMPVRPLRPFFEFWQDGLRRLAPGGAANPTVALLTPGTAHRQWFEHMYLSRELSCALVEGGDLTVRGGEVFIKTLKGLQQVDVLLRRIDGRMIDPLELEAGSLIGVPGLIDVARAGRVHITNDPGSGAVEAPALAAFLPDLCRRLLGEELRLPSVPTLWLGEAAALSRVLAGPDGWNLRPATDGNADALSPAAMAPESRAALLARIRARPWEWAASAPVEPSVAPCLMPDGLQPRPVVVRLFLSFDGTGWRAMPGGLARVLGSAREGAPGRGGIAKDVWVLSEERGDAVGLPLLPQPRLALRRTTGDLPSRVADNLFWLGRYVERLERAARLVRAAITRLSRAQALLPPELSELDALGRCLAEAGVIADDAATAAATRLMAGALLTSVRPGATGPEGTTDGGAIHALFVTIARLTENVRDRLTGDMYATFTQTLRAARGDATSAGRSLDGLAHAMVSIMRFSTAVAGVAAENMVRGGGFLFLDLGRRVERAQAVATEVGFALDQPPAHVETGLRLALELCDSAITYRNRYLNVLQPAPVLDLVLADQGNPRGLAFQLVAMHGLLDELGGESGVREMLAGAAAGLLAEVEALVAEVLAAPDQAVSASALPPLLAGVAGGIADLSNRITRRYFALLPAVQTVGLTSEVAELKGAA